MTADLDAARKQAEDALVWWERPCVGDEVECATELARCLRALLAATTPAAGETPTFTHWSGSATRPDVAAPSPRPSLPDGVREAAEELRAYLPVWINGGLGEDGQLRYRIEDLLAALAQEVPHDR